MAFAIFRSVFHGSLGYIPLEISLIGNLYRLALTNLQASEKALAIVLKVLFIYPLRYLRYYKEVLYVSISNIHVPVKSVKSVVSVLML